jgi:nucleoside-diphosphate-sugar epimerase
VRTSTYPRILVTGAGGFIGHHRVTALKLRGYWVRGVDTSPPEYTVGEADDSSCETCAASTSACWPHAASTRQPA